MTLRRVLLYGVIANLLVLLALAWIYPEPMVSPGDLAAAHQQLATDCFACHAPLRGARDQDCLACHPRERIGRFRSNGEPIPASDTRPAFHQQLSDQQCLACHTEHRGRDPQPAMLDFRHDLLQPALRERCESCHRKPDDVLHRDIPGHCAQCHDTQGWSPAHFDHDRYFRLDRDHNVECSRCHGGGDFSRYDCYGCHEHTPANIRAEHLEEGIRDFEDCVRCHRSADEPEGEGEGGD